MEILGIIKLDEFQIVVYFEIRTDHNIFKTQDKGHVYMAL